MKRTTAVEEVETALLAHRQELRRRDTLRASVAANSRALDLATDRYTSGLENFLSVLDAQRALYAAEDDQARSEHKHDREERTWRDKWALTRLSFPSNTFVC